MEKGKDLQKSRRPELTAKSVESNSKPDFMSLPGVSGSHK